MKEVCERKREEAKEEDRNKIKQMKYTLWLLYVMILRYGRRRCYIYIYYTNRKKEIKKKRERNYNNKNNNEKNRLWGSELDQWRTHVAAKVDLFACVSIFVRVYVYGLYRAPCKGARLTRSLHRGFVFENTEVDDPDQRYRLGPCFSDETTVHTAVMGLLRRKDAGQTRFKRERRNPVINQCYFCTCLRRHRLLTLLMFNSVVDAYVVWLKIDKKPKGIIDIRLRQLLSKKIFLPILEFGGVSSSGVRHSSFCRPAENIFHLNVIGKFPAHSEEATKSPLTRRNVRPDQQDQQKFL